MEHRSEGPSAAGSSAHAVHPLDVCRLRGADRAATAARDGAAQQHRAGDHQRLSDHSPGHRSKSGSTVTGKLTELAMKHIRWALTWSSRARSSRSASAIEIEGRRVTWVKRPERSSAWAM